MSSIETYLHVGGEPHHEFSQQYGTPNKFLHILYSMDVTQALYSISAFSSIIYSFSLHVALV